MNKKKFKITFLLDKSNLWLEKKLKKYNFNLSNKYTFNFSKNYKKVKKQDIVFLISYTKILPKIFLKNNKLVLVAHPSKLPQDKGFAPLQHQILKNKNKVYMSLIEAKDKVDSGDIYIQYSFNLKGTELSDEIRDIQGSEVLKIIRSFLIKFPKIKPKQQIGKENFNKRRYPEDSQLSINKTIKQQFNHLRINDNELYPSFFIYKKQKYIVKILRVKKKTKK